MIRRSVSTLAVLRHRVNAGDLRPHAIEAAAERAEDAVDVRRSFYAGNDRSHAIHDLPHRGVDYESAIHRNCENVIGYTPIPLGMVGPLRVDGVDRNVPFATTEGALVASLNRGAKVLRAAGGVETVVTDVGITRAPLVRFPDLASVTRCEAWLETHWEECVQAYATTTSHGRLQRVTVHQSGRHAHLRFAAHTGNAMGMNGVSKGVAKVMERLNAAFPAMEVLSYSGNACTDKKASAMNWILGRGKKVVAEACLTEALLREHLHVDADALVRLHVQKNYVGSALAACVGGNNAHAANAVGGLFLATGQDAAQIGTSSASITSLERQANGDVVVGVTMPCVEVATIGGGTGLTAQRAALRTMGIDDSPCAASTLASIVGATVLSGELSLLAAHASNDLLSAHMRLGRGD